MSITQTQGNQDGAVPDAPEDPPEAATTRKTTFRVYADFKVRDKIERWAAASDVAGAQQLLRSFPVDAVDDDLMYLGTYDATHRDNAAEQMMADKEPSDRVRLVQLTYAAHIDMWFPVLSVASGYVKDVPAVWEINPVSRIGGR
jgi:hypothetical protein